MRNSPDGLRGIPCRGRAGAKQTSARSRRTRAREQVSSPKKRPSQRKEIAAYPNPPWSDLSPNCSTRTTSPRFPYAPTARAQPTMSRAGWSPVGGENGGHVEMAVSLISTRRLKMISNQSGGNARSPERPSQRNDSQRCHTRLRFAQDSPLEEAGFELLVPSINPAWPAGRGEAIEHGRGRRPGDPQSRHLPRG